MTNVCAPLNTQVPPPPPLPRVRDQLTYTPQGAPAKYVDYAGTGGKFLRSLQRLYQDTKCAVRVGGRLTDWFPNNSGL